MDISDLSQELGALRARVEALERKDAAQAVSRDQASGNDLWLLALLAADGQALLGLHRLGATLYVSGLLFRQAKAWEAGN